MGFWGFKFQGAAWFLFALRKKVSVFGVILVRIFPHSEWIFRIQSECRKIRTRITPNTDTFYAVSTKLSCEGLRVFPFRKYFLKIWENIQEKSLYLKQALLCIVFIRNLQFPSYFSEFLLFNALVTAQKWKNP